MVRPAQFLGPLQGDQPTLPAPARRTLRVPPQPRTLALASDLRSSLAVHFLDHGRLLAADGPSTSSYAANALLPMSDQGYPEVDALMLDDFHLGRIQVKAPAPIPEADARWDWEWMSSWGLLSGAFEAATQINTAVQQAAHVLQ